MPSTTVAELISIQFEADTPPATLVRADGSSVTAAAPINGPETVPRPPKNTMIAMLMAIEIEKVPEIIIGEMYA
jgi:hypothetical protein